MGLVQSSFNEVIAFVAELDQAKTERLARLGYARSQEISLALYIYFGSIEISPDTKVAICFGLAIGLGIVIFNVIFPGDPYDYDLEGADASAEAIKELEKLRKENDEELRRMGIKRDAIDGDDFVEVESTEANVDAKDDAEGKSKDGLRQRKKKKKKDGESKEVGGKELGDSGQTKVVTAKGAMEDLQSTRAESVKKAKKLIMETKLQEIDKIAHRFDNPKVRQMMGVDENEMKDIVKQTKRDIRSGKTHAEPLMSWQGCFDTFFYVTMLSAIFYFANKDYGFNIIVFLAKHFPKEAKVLESMANSAK
jgi:hypothetical protein